MKVRWTAPALRDLEAIGDTIARDNPTAASRVVARVLHRVEMLGEHSHLGRPGRVPGTRELVITDTPFIVPYRVREKDVEVLADFHGARQWPEDFGQ
jgi:toxin ParE1/3/4